MPTENEINVFLAVGLVVAIAYLIFQIYVPIWFPPEQPHHVAISRLNDSVIVKWMGGADSSFVGDFRIRVNNGSWQYYQKPRLHGIIAEIPADSNSRIDVESIDLAIKQYRPIGSADSV